MPGRAYPTFHITVVARDPNQAATDYEPAQLELSGTTPERAKEWIGEHIDKGFEWLEKVEPKE